MLIVISCIATFSCHEDLLYDGLEVQNLDFTIPRDGLVAEYLFNGDAKDSSGYGNDGNDLGTPDYSQSDRFGNANSACGLNGVNSAVSIPENSDLDGFSSIAISLWIMPTVNLTSGMGRKEIIYKGTGLSGQVSYVINYNDADGILQVAVVSSDGQTHSKILYSTSFDANTWYHFVVSYSHNGDVIFYLNAECVGTYDEDNMVGNVLNTSHPVQLGRRADNNFYFPGLIDDVRIYNRALSATEVYALYTEGN